MTERDARRIWNGNVLCGRMVDGQHACRGLVGYIQGDTFYMLPGVIEDTERAGLWGPTERSAERSAP